MSKATITHNNDRGYPVVTCDRTGTELRTLYGIDDIQWFNNYNGFHFFDRESMRFFNSRILSDVYRGRWFVTSERNDMPYSQPATRLYTVRYVREDGTLETVGEFQQYETAYQAKKAARLAAERGRVDG